MRADRLVAIVLLLQARGRMSAPALAAELEVSTRTVYRDVDALSGAGVPVYAERGPQGGIRLLEGYRTDLTGLNEGEAETLLLLGIPGPLSQLGLGERGDTARRKVLASLSRTDRDAAEAVGQKLYVDPAPWTRAPVPEHLVEVARALWAEQQIRIDYVRADNDRVSRRVDPLGLVLKAGTWYLIGHMGEWEVTFRVERIRGVEVLDRPVTRPDGFDLVDHWAEVIEDIRQEDRPVGVELLVERGAAQAVTPRLGEAVRDQVVAGVAGEADRFAVTAEFPSEAEALAAVLGLGSVVELVAPPALREALARQVAELHARYVSAG